MVSGSRVSHVRALEIDSRLEGQAEGAVVIAAHRGAHAKRDLPSAVDLFRDPLQQVEEVGVADHLLGIDGGRGIETHGTKQSGTEGFAVELGTRGDADHLVGEDDRDPSHKGMVKSPTDARRLVPAGPEDPRVSLDCLNPGQRSRRNPLGLLPQSALRTPGGSHETPKIKGIVRRTLCRTRTVTEPSW